MQIHCGSLVSDSHLLPLLPSTAKAALFCPDDDVAGFPIAMSLN